MASQVRFVSIEIFTGLREDLGTTFQTVCPMPHGTGLSHLKALGPLGNDAITALTMPLSLCDSESHRASSAANQGGGLSSLSHPSSFS